MQRCITLDGQEFFKGGECLATYLPDGNYLEYWLPTTQDDRTIPYQKRTYILYRSGNEYKYYFLSDRDGIAPSGGTANKEVVHLGAGGGHVLVEKLPDELAFGISLYEKHNPNSPEGP